MIAKPILTCVVAFIAVVSYSQSFTSKTPVSLSKGGVGVIEEGIESVVLNPSGTAQISKLSFSTNYYLPYFSKELSSQNIGIIFPTQLVVFSAYADRFGYHLFKEYKYGVSFSKCITSNIKAAFQFNYQQNYQSKNISGGQFFSGFGFQISPVKQLIIGCFISNPERSSVSMSSEKIEIPTVYIIGTEWWASDSFSIALELEKQLRFSAVNKLGIEYAVNKSIWMRAGIYGEPMHFTFGAGFQISGVTIDAGVANHEILGLSTGIGLKLQVNDTK